MGIIWPYPPSPGEGTCTKTINTPCYIQIKAGDLPVGEYTYGFKAFDNRYPANVTEKAINIVIFEENTNPTISNFKLKDSFGNDLSGSSVGSGQNVYIDFTIRDVDESSENQLNQSSLEVNGALIDSSHDKCSFSATEISCSGLAFAAAPGNGSNNFSATVSVTDKSGGFAEQTKNVRINALPSANLAVSLESAFIDQNIHVSASMSDDTYIREAKICADISQLSRVCDAPIKTCTFSESDTTFPCSVSYNHAQAGMENGRVVFTLFVVDGDGATLSTPPYKTVNFKNHFGFSANSLTNRSYRVGDTIELTINVAKFSNASNQINTYSLFSNEAEIRNASISPEIPVTGLPMTDSEANTKQVTISWNANHLGTNRTLSLTLTDDQGASITKNVGQISVSHPVPDKPISPKLEVVNGDNGYKLIISQFDLTREFAITTRLNGRDHQNNTLVASKSKVELFFPTTTNMHGQSLQFEVVGINYFDQNPSLQTRGDVTLSELRDIEHTIAKPLPPRFNHHPRQVGGQYTLTWPDNNDGVTHYYKVMSWAGLPSDKGKVANKETAKLSENQLTLSLLEKGKYTYELIACNAMDLCTAGQQLTIDHMIPILQSVTATDCTQVQCGDLVSFYISGLFLHADQSQIRARIRATGEIFTATNQSFSNNTLTVNFDKRVYLGLTQGGLQVFATNGVKESGKYVQSILSVDSTGSSGQPDLLDSQITISDNGYLYVGRETGLAGYKVRGDKLDKLWLHEPETNNSGRDDIPAKVVARPLVESVSDDDLIYFGSENHQFYKLRHRPSQSSDSLRRVQDWLFTSKGPIIASAQLDQDGNLYVGSMDSNLYSLDKESGHVQWQYTFPAGINHQVDVAASGQIYVKTEDGELHVIDRSMISANAIKWRDLGVLYDAFREHIERWEKSRWEPTQEHTHIVQLTKAMLVILQQSPSKDQLSLLAYLYENGYSLNEIISALINANSELTNADDTQFINMLFQYFIGPLNGDEVLGGGNQHYWVEQLRKGTTRTEVFITLLHAGAARNTYDSVTNSLLYYFYDFCLVSKDCYYDFDSDGDGLSDQVEAELGSNPVDPGDGLLAPSLSLAKVGTDTVRLTMSANSIVEEYELYVSKQNQDYYRAEVIAAHSAGEGPVSDDVTSWAKQYENGDYRFKVKACVRVALLNNPRVLHCSNNFSNEESIVINDSTQTSVPSISLPFTQAQNTAPSSQVLLQHARLSPTVGSFRVSESGSATYSIPVELPSGITGVKPSVSLDYNSQTSRTNLALGWSLNATSSITRCRQTRAQDGQFKGITLSDEDRYCLDGQRLIPLDVNESIDGLTTLATFETEIESHQTIVLASHPETGLDMFVVRGKDGSFRYYGGTENSEVRITNADDNEYVLTWLLHKVTDNLQNDKTSIYYSYTNEATNAQVLGLNEKVLDRIEYSGNTVQFNYDNSGVFSSSYIDGAKMEQAAQLTGVRVSNHRGFELSNYKLEFEYANNRIRLLDKVSQCRNDVCKRPIEFDYNSFALSTNYQAFSTIFSTSGSNKLAAMTLIDTQGDGTAEIATLEKVGDRRYELCFWEGNTYETPSKIDCQSINRFDNEESVGIQVIDANGDGKQSLWINLQDKYNPSHTSNNYYWKRAYLDAGVIQLTSLPLSDHYAPFIKNSNAADFNGDGFADLVFQQKEVSLNSSSHWYSLFSNRNELFVALYDPGLGKFLRPQMVYSSKPGSYSQLTQKNTPWFAMDVNFDGLADIISLKCPANNCAEHEASSVFANFNQGVTSSGRLRALTSNAITSSSAKHIEHVTPADFNGDGLIDFVYLKTSLYNDKVKEWRVMLSKSSSRILFEDKHLGWAKTDPMQDALLSEKIAPLAMDVNKDGKLELYFFVEDNNPVSPDWTKFTWHPEEEKFEESGLYSPFTTPGLDLEKGDYAFFSDYNRDGVPDLMFKAGGKVVVKYNLSQSPFAGYLSDITQGYGNKTSVQYSVMTDSGIYKPIPSSQYDSDFSEDLFDQSLFKTQGLKIMPVNGAMPLVSSVMTDSPSSQDETLRSEVRYNYEGALAQFGGRGMLGFKSLTTVNIKDGQQFSTTTRYHQAFPLTGMPARTVKAYNGTVISSAVNDYYLKSNSHSSGRTYQVYNQLAKECASLINMNAGAAIGSSQCSSTQTQQDAYGNVTKTISKQLADNRSAPIVDLSNDEAWRSIDSLSVASPLSSVTTSNNYGATDSYKKLGRLVSSTVTHSAIDKTDHTLTSNFTYYGASHANAYMLESETIAQGKGCKFELTTNYQYDDLGNLKQKSTSNSACDSDDKQTRITETIYDSEKRYPLYSRQKANKEEPSTAGNVLWAKSSQVEARNAFGLPTEVRTVNGTRVTTLYDVFGSKIGTYSASGAQSYQYLTACQDSDKCVAQVNKVVNGELAEKQFMDRMGRVYKTSTVTVLGTWLDTTVEHDQYGRALKQQAPGSAEITYSYDAFDRVTSTTDNNSQVTTTYTQSDLVSTVELSGAGVSTGKQTTTTTKNALGQVESVTDAKGNVLRYTYDSRGKQLTVYSSADNMILIDNSYDLLGRSETAKDVDRGDWSYEYNAFGELIKQTDARGVATHIKYDLLGRKVRQWHTQPNSMSANSTYIEQTDIVYEGESQWHFGTLAENVHQLQSATQGDDWAQYYYYDTFGRTAATLTALETQQCVDGVVFNTRLNDLRIKQGYNNPNTPSRDLSDPLSSRCVIQQMAYDEFGRVSYQFDDYRRLESGEYIDARGVRNTYQHGQVAQTHEAREGQYGQQYYEVQSLNARGQVTQYKKGNAIMAVSYDDAGMVKTIASTNYRHIQADSYSFDGMGNLLSRAQIALPEQNYEYDLLNRVTHIENKELFRYDANGNLRSKANFSSSGLNGSCTVINEKWSQHYGQGEAPRHAITSRSYNTGDVDNSCSSTPIILPPPIDIGPILPPGDALYSADIGVQSASANTDRTVTERFTYDKNGNQTKLYIDGSGYRSIDYTARNKAANIIVDGKVVRFSYDANNRRYKRVDDSQTIYYVGALELTVSSTESGDNTPFIKRYIGNDAQQKYFMNGNSAMQWMFTDHQGSIIAVTNRNYELLARYSYDVFGAQKYKGPQNLVDTLNFSTAQRIFDTVSDNFRGYTGHEPVKIGSDSRIIHMNGRIYDTSTGRFMQADPVVQAPSNLQNYNAYSYVLNNPLSYTDPSGYLFKKLWKKIKPFIGAIAAIAVSLYCQVCGATMWNAAMTGAAIGASSAAINGGNILKGAILGGLSGAAFQQIGANFNGPEGSGFFAEGGIGHIATHGVAGGVMSVLQGGKFGHGFVSAGLTKALNINGIVGTAAKDAGIRVALAAIVGGTISKVTGGKFSNGAITAAFAQAFNGEKYASKIEARKELMHKVNDTYELKALQPNNQRFEELSVAGYTADYEERSVFGDSEEYFTHLGPEQSFKNGVAPLTNVAGGANGKLHVRSSLPGADNYTLDAKVIRTSYDSGMVENLRNVWQAQSLDYGHYSENYNAIPVYVQSSEGTIYRFLHNQKTLSWDSISDVNK
ncbi:RHS repeat-associated core domain-containing protein [Pseudoalteromonas rubra]|nr:RHS repeat-associated core domain-containing protein [Pseudoalteromonas rubra]